MDSMIDKNMEQFLLLTLIQNETLKMEESNKNINLQRKRLGFYKKTRVGSKFSETWEDGQEIRNVQEIIVILTKSDF